MIRRDDDLSPFRDDPVFRALTGPATPDELAGEADVLAAFRAANASRPMRRFAARVGTSGAVAVAAVALSAGAAAAYTAELPSPLQQIAHDAAGPIGVPAPTRHHHSGSGGSKSTPSTVAAPAPTVAATNAAGVAAGGMPRPHVSPTTLPSSPTSSPVVTPTAPVVVGTPTSTPTPTQSSGPSLKGASLTVTASDTKVSVGSTITLTGQLGASDATPIAGRRVALFERLTGPQHWTRVGDPVVTSATGGVTFAVPVEQNARLVLRARGHLHSSVVKVVALPTITEAVAASQTAPDQETVTVTVIGGDEGDVIGLNWFAGKRRHQQTTLDASGMATFTVRAPQHRTVSYRLYLRRTQAHGAASSQSFSLPPA